jgi:hypothetical protein
MEKLIFFFFLNRPDGKMLEVPLRNVASSAHKAVAGDVVTIAHERFSRSATPVDPHILRMRNDITWEHVIINHRSDIAAFLNRK